ncbi:MAG TPA: DUF4340 domain-containing protein, partial [Tichowtungia sp.]|nr:DUF4340 domain-containing protein [Tichowtungia sp.]
QQISRLTISAGENQTELVQTNGQWHVVRPARWAAEPAAVDQLLDAIANSVILEFIDNPNTNQIAVIDTASWSVTFGSDDSQHTLQISEPLDDGLMMVRRDQSPSFELIAGGTFEDAFRNPLFYRTRSVLEIAPEQIKAVTLTAADREFRIEKTDGRFTAADRKQNPDPDVLQELTAELAGLRAERYVAFNPESLGSYGLDNPQARLSIALQGTNILGRVLLLGGTAEDGRYAMLQGQPVVFVLPERSAEILTQELTQPLEKEPEEITQP